MQNVASLPAIGSGYSPRRNNGDLTSPKRLQRGHLSNDIGSKKLLLPKVSPSQTSSPRYPSQTSSPRYDDLTPREDWLLTVPRRWLPSNFVSSPNTSSKRRRGKTHLQSGSLSPRDGGEGSGPKLPAPIDQVTELIPLKLRPPDAQLQQCVEASDPMAFFASLLVSKEIIQRLQSKPHWDPVFGSLELGPSTSEVVGSAELGAATALRHNDCRSLRINHVATDIDLRMLRSWESLQALELWDLSDGPSCRELPDNIQKLTLRYANSYGPPARIVADALPRRLRELRLAGGKATGLQEAVKQAPGLLWLDCSQWWEFVPIPELVYVAETLEDRGGHFVWPSRKCLMQTVMKVQGYGRRAKLMDWADEAATCLVARHQEEVQERGFGLDMLSRSLQYARDMKCNIAVVSPAHNLLVQMQLSVVTQRRAMAQRLGLPTVPFTPEEKPKRKGEGKARVKAHIEEVANAQVIGVEEVIEALGTFGFDREEAAHLTHYMDCECKGVATLEDVGNMLTRPAPASAADLYDFFVYLMKAYPSLHDAFAAFDKEGNGEISLDEFEMALEKSSVRRSNKVPARSLFAALDAHHMSGFIDQEEFLLLAFFANIHKMQHVERIHKFIVEYWGDLTTAFKGLDDNKSGAVSKEEFESTLRRLEYKDWNMVTEVFNFIEPEGSGVLSLKKMLKLQDFNTESFLDGVRKLVMELTTHYGSLEKAYSLMGCSADDDETISCSEFVQACARLDTKKFTDIDPRMLYRFLDDSQDGSVTAEEFLRLSCFNSDSARMGLIESLKNFRSVFGFDPSVAFNKLQDAASAEVLKAAKEACLA